MFQGFQVYSDLASKIFREESEARSFARQHSKENEGLTVLLSTYWNNSQGRSGGRTLGFYFNGSCN